MGRHIVAGPPCSGKSTYVRGHMAYGDVIYDYDTMHQAISGLPLYQHNTELRDYVVEARDAVLDLLAADKERGAWMITASPRKSEIVRLQKLLDAEVVFLDVDQATAHERCDSDKRPDEWHGYIDDWFEKSDISPSDWSSATPQRVEVEMARKIFRGGLQLKEGGQPGEFKAVFATTNTIDHDGDVTVPGAFTDGEEVLISAYGHQDKQLPVGKGKIREEGNQAIVEGAFFLDTIGGKEHYTTIKNLGALQQYSYGFEVMQSEPGQFDGKAVRFLKKMRVFEVSPVQRGAGVDTQTLSIKSKDVPKEEKSINLSGLVDKVRQAFDAQFNPKGPNASDDWAWPEEIYDDHLVASWKGDKYQVNYRLDEAGQYVFAPQNEWIKGELVFIAGAKGARPLAENKSGRVLAARNAQRLAAALRTLNEIMKDAGLLETAEGDSEDGSEGDGQGKARKGTPRASTPSTLSERVAMEILESSIEV